LPPGSIRSWSCGPRPGISLTRVRDWERADGVG
jgi:hypothetical protein